MTKLSFYKLASLGVLLALPVAAAAASSVADQWAPTRVASSSAVPAGSAPMDQALSTIIPAPYRIILDAGVPSSTVLVWPAGDDWMKVLRAAVAPMDLVVMPDWPTNSIRIVRWRADAAARMPEAPVARSNIQSGSGISSARQPLPTLPPGAMPIYGATRMDEHATPVRSYKPASTSPAFTDARPMAAPVVKAAPEPAHRGTFVIPSGTMLSEGLAQYVKQFGWSLRWNFPEDYLLDAALPIEGDTVQDGVGFVMRTYQSQGGLVGGTSVFATPNKVVVIKAVEVEIN